MVVGIIIIAIVLFGSGVATGYHLCMQHHSSDIDFYKKYKRYGHPEGAMIEQEELNREVDKILNGKK